LVGNPNLSGITIVDRIVSELKKCGACGMIACMNRVIQILNTVKENQPKNPIAKVGLPLALSFYEQLPFWHTFFTEL
jgi:hypothetical protein